MTDADSSRGASDSPLTTRGTSYLLLGEGDFTYSLDACRYIVASSSSSHHHHLITCTGIDSIDELRAKYRDADFVLGRIRACSSASSRVFANVCHGVNAVDDDVTGGSATDAGPTTPSSSHDRVIFNHPHLGTEDAVLHSRFLAHLFHASAVRWMSADGGLLHLTLVVGQCERWKCLERAEKHGLFLLRRGKFVPPPPPPPPAGGGTPVKKAVGGGDRTYYSLRRHQSGRSFANRRRMQGDGSGGGVVRGDNGSETLVFGRASHHHPTASTPRDDDADDLFLPWERDAFSGIDAPRKTDPLHLDGSKSEKESAILNIERTCGNDDDADSFPCQYCPRFFRERRSLRNHMASVHPDREELSSPDAKNQRSRNRKTKKRTNDGNGKMSTTSDDGGRDRCYVATQQSDDGTTPDGGISAGPPWTCEICERTAPPREDDKQLPIAKRRTFPNKGALIAHQRAKHYGVHLDIKPDWHCRTGAGEVEINGHGQKDADPRPFPIGGGTEILRCPICDFRFHSELDVSRHAIEFLPSSSAIAIATARGSTNGDPQHHIMSPSPSYECAHCSKSFAEVRAQRQHENFCSFRTVSATTTGKPVI
jgi:hypothetical protein